MAVAILTVPLDTRPCPWLSPPLHPPTLSSWGSGLRTWATERNWIKQFLTRREQAAVGLGVRDPAPLLPPPSSGGQITLLIADHGVTLLWTPTSTTPRPKINWSENDIFNLFSAATLGPPRPPDKLFTERSCLRPKSVRLGLERFRATVPGDRFTEIDLGKCCFEWVVSVPLSAPLTLHSLNLEEKNFYTRIN